MIKKINFKKNLFILKKCLIIVIERISFMKKNNLETKTYKAGETIYSHNDKAEFIFLIHSGKVRIESKHGLELGVLETGEIFGEVGHIIESPRTVSAIAVTNSLIKIIDEKTVKQKMNTADPVLAAIIRGLSLRIGDANALAEKHWLELSLYKSLAK
jgi:CRP-like cAMP-binding protein